MKAVPHLNILVLGVGLCRDSLTGEKTLTATKAGGFSPIQPVRRVDERAAEKRDTARTVLGVKTAKKNHGTVTALVAWACIQVPALICAPSLCL